MKPIWESWFCHIDVTSRCPMSCLYCSRYNRHLRKDQKCDMPLAIIEKSLDSLREWPAKIGIMGGEPILHNQFQEMCSLIQSKFPREKMGLWTSGGPNWAKYEPLAQQTFGFIAYNEHNPIQQAMCRHQRLTVAVKDVVKDTEYMNELIDDCWVQRIWCPTITSKGGFFCEIAAAQDWLWDGPGGYEIEQHWWKKAPNQFKDQVDRYCKNCGMCVPMERDLLGDGVEKMSPSVYKKMCTYRNANIEIGKNVEIFDKQLSIDEIETKKLSWYPGNYRGDHAEDGSNSEGMGSTKFRVKV